MLWSVGLGSEHCLCLDCVEQVWTAKCWRQLGQEGGAGLQPGTPVLLLWHWPVCVQPGGQTALQIWKVKAQDTCILILTDFYVYNLKGK